MDINPSTLKVENYGWRFFQLAEYAILGHKIFTTVDPQYQFSIDLNNGTSIRSFVYKITTDDYAFADYYVTKMGYRWIIAKTAREIYPLVKSLIDWFSQTNATCAMKYYEEEAFAECVKSANLSE
jgi:hypothetical protein